MAPYYRRGPSIISLLKAEQTYKLLSAKNFYFFESFLSLTPNCFEISENVSNNYIVQSTSNYTTIKIKVNAFLLKISNFL